MGNLEIVGKENFIKRASEIVGENIRTFYLVSTSLIKFSSKITNERLDEIIKRFVNLYFEKQDIYSLVTFKAQEIFILMAANDDKDVKNYYKALLDVLKKESLINDLKRACGAYRIKDNEESINDSIYRARLAREESINLDKVVFFNEKIMDKHSNEAYVKHNFSDALANGEFKLYIQPKYDSETGRICGAEALSRWVLNPDEILMPAFYIPFLEKSGRIVYLDNYIYEKTCEFIGSRIANKLEVVPVSVNFSQAHVFDDTLVEFLKATADKYNVPYNMIHIEITESTTNRNVEEELATIEKIRSIGFGVELDDFGTGYSNLEMLTKMPVDVIKIDKVIFSNIKDQNFIYFYTCIIILAHKLGAKVTIEGVETINQLETIKSLSADYIQGFYFSKPIPDYEFDFMLNTSQVQDVSCNTVEILPFDIESLKRLFDKSSIPIYFVKIDDDIITYLYVNSAYSKIYDKTPRYFIGKSTTEVFGDNRLLFKSFKQTSEATDLVEYYDVTRNGKLYVKYSFSNIAPGYVCCMLEPDFSDNAATDFGIFVLEVIDEVNISLKYVSEKILEHFGKTFKQFSEIFNDVKIDPIQNDKIYKDVAIFKNVNNEDIILTFIVKPVKSMEGRTNLICYINDITDFKGMLL